MKKQRIISYIYVFSLLLVMSFSLASAVYGQGTIVNPDDDCIKTGDCQLSDLMRLVTNLSNIMLGLIGAIVLLMFVYGGLIFLTSAGNRERVEKGKRVMVGSLIGMAIVFMSYTIVGFVFNILGVNNGESFASTGWFK